LGDGNSNNQKNIFTAKTDLVLKLKKNWAIETGFKTNTSNSHNAALYFYQTGLSGRLPDTFQTNSFHYKESITSFTCRLQKQFGGSLLNRV